MGVRNVEELIAWQLAVEFRDSVYELFKSSREARRDYQFRAQLWSSSARPVANIAEGFYRNRTRVFILFLSYARASLAEAKGWIRDGIKRGYFTTAACASALQLEKRCSQAVLKLIQRLEDFL